MIHPDGEVTKPYFQHLAMRMAARSDQAALGGDDSLPLETYNLILVDVEHRRASLAWTAQTRAPDVLSGATWSAGLTFFGAAYLYACSVRPSGLRSRSNRRQTLA